MLPFRGVLWVWDHTPFGQVLPDLSRKGPAHAWDQLK